MKCKRCIREKFIKENPNAEVNLLSESHTCDMDKEKIVRYLVDTFKDRSDLHEAYKEKMKEILMNFSIKLIRFLASLEDGLNVLDIEKICNDFVEENFKPED